jgi:tRNA 2-thiocytidine biosynthesis protein TtcA
VARLRRGILYTAAERLGCTKVALGHHRDDGLETFLLNLFYAGKLQAMPAKLTTDDGRFEVIRPLIDCAEKDIQTFADSEGFPILPCNLCGSQEGLKRERVSELLASLERENPSLRAIMANALGRRTSRRCRFAQGALRAPRRASSAGSGCATTLVGPARATW